MFLIELIFNVTTTYKLHVCEARAANSLVHRRVHLCECGVCKYISYGNNSFNVISLFSCAYEDMQGTKPCIEIRNCVVHATFDRKLHAPFEIKFQLNYMASVGSSNSSQTDVDSGGSSRAQPNSHLEMFESEIE